MSGIGAAALSAGIAATASTAANVANGVQASNLNSRNRRWQETMMQRQREWALEDWERENDVSAWSDRVSNAGLNPALVAGQSSLSQPSSATHSPQGSPAPSQFMPHYDASGISNAASLLLQGQQVEAQSKVANAQSVKIIIDAAVQGFKIGGKELFDYVLDKFAPYLSGTNPNDSIIAQTAHEELRSYQLNNASIELQNSLSQKYSEKQILTGIEQIEQSISESVGRLNSMRVVNDKTYQDMANSIVKTAAEAFNLYAQGNKANADASTVNAIRSYVVKAAKADASMKSDDAYTSSVYREGFENAAGYITSDKGKKNLGERVAREGAFDANMFQYFLDRELKMLLGTAGTAAKFIRP